ncbi:MAG: outer membrane lipoprotein-sorting protein [Moraxellaceae bacterium]|nr:outer membrane lipoprotein-sorting protein [Moraxellaceae bacterium]MCP5176444.1 outer membrane lipoprotein-sorting protein [Moraxellaceae bacterium]
MKNILFILFASITIQPLWADQAQDIAQAADKQLHGYGDSSAKLKMTLISANNSTASRELRVKSLDLGKDGDRSLLIFDTPRDVAGTALLSHTQATGDDLQWLYLPSLSRVKQISGRNKSGPFMGSEFSFEDMVISYWQKYSYKLIKEEKCGSNNSLSCYVLEKKPIDSNSGYSKQLVWIDKQQYLQHKIEFYDRKNSLAKIYTAIDFKKYADNLWRPSQMLMVNQQNKRQTRLEWSDYQFKTGLSKEDFSENALKRQQ